ncbi:MAG: hypothetical protein KatS3mg036_0768 [Ignavibacterium sp.]|uniref:hypothetical protein n=1 Tax=Ignavibacterium sp. TaxID=2651167 RepID=UPI0021DE3562|nr:hypothetical protein [Ignavibacterium sp.]BDQ04312.1 MAG: hypothetical protein KatS3mg037_2887 [Ignavibacterium sp.]GIV45950.1 MAG: hypothetical protein KatS3mg036_0768 [Ignavibacterium sp.]
MIQNNQIASAYSPPFRIVAKYFIAAIISFVIFNLLLTLNYEDISGHHFQPKILSVTHIATLGFITMIIFGAMFQLVPVVLEVKLFSTILAEVQFWIFSLGIILLVYKFWHFGSALSFTLPAVLLNTAMLIFSVNIIASMVKVKKWNLTGTYLASSIFWLLTTAVAGLLLSINLDTPFIKLNHLQYLKLHVITAFVGWVGMVVMGVSFKLIPMFTLSHDYKLNLANWAVALINIGLLGVNWIMHYPDTQFYNVIFGSVIFAGMLLYLIQISVIFRKRIRKKLDVGLKFTAISLFILGITTLLNFSFLFFNYENVINLTLVYGILFLVGFASTLIVGQMYKIVPFLVWYHKYSSKVGIEKVPMLKDMFNEKLAEYHLYLMISGLVISIISLSFQLKVLLLFGFSILLISSIIFSFNMIKIFRS